MKRIIKIGDRRGVLEWEMLDGTASYSLAWPDEQPKTGVANVAEVEPGVYSVLLGNRSYEAKITPSGSEWAVDVDGHHFVIDALDPRSERRAVAGATASGPSKLPAPMPGKVVRLLVEVGAMVAYGQPLVVVEAMKMQNELKAPRPGRVISILTSAGATVASGEILVVME